MQCRSVGTLIYIFYSSGRAIIGRRGIIVVNYSEYAQCFEKSEPDELTIIARRPHRPWLVSGAKNYEPTNYKTTLQINAARYMLRSSSVMMWSLCGASPEMGFVARGNADGMLDFRG